MMEWVYIVLFIAGELFEIVWQKAPTLFGVLERIYRWYNKSIFFVFLLHPTLYITIYLLFETGWSFPVQIVFGLKIGDIALKLLFVKKVFFEKNVDEPFYAMLRMPLRAYMFYSGLVIYPILIFFGVR